MGVFKCVTLACRKEQRKVFMDWERTSEGMLSVSHSLLLIPPREKKSSGLAVLSRLSAFNSHVLA